MRTLVLISSLVVMLLAGVCLAHEPDAPRAAAATGPWDWLQSSSLTNDWFGLGEKAEQQGVTVELTLTQVYQRNLHGGLSTHRRSGRYTGAYDLEMTLDLEKILKLPGASLYAHGEGGWSDGLGDTSVGGLFDVNDSAAGYRSLDLTELYYEQKLLDGRVQFRVGKLDVSGGFECRGCPASFDGNAYANDETTQFLNGALVNNPTIPFPSKGLGAVVHVEPVDGWYVSGGLADAQADKRETGFRTAFHGRDEYFAIFETGVTPVLPSARGPLQGTYRAGLWYDPREKDRLDGNGSERDDAGFYLSFDQQVWRERAVEGDSQGLGVFARYGWADDDVNEIKCFWSTGASYQGLLPGRDDDVLGFGVAQGGLSERAGHSASHETAMELFYNVQVTPWFQIGPSVQYVFNPGGDRTAGDAVVTGLRALIRF
ncbi:MAG TPA: carbohydrate porin [Phycisphaerae bacterium]|nr:carbohydrate porin [Phycisphaerae bacterium]